MTPESYYKLRVFKDKLAKYAIGVGGLSVIFAVVLIFFYLVYVTLPIFKSAEIEQTTSYHLAWNQEPVLAMDVEEYGEIGFIITETKVAFFEVANGELLESMDLTQDYGKVTAVSGILAQEGVYVLAFDSGQALVLKRSFKITYPNDKRKLTPQFEYPLGQEAFDIVNSDEQVTNIVAQSTEDSITITAQTTSGQVWFNKWVKEVSFLDASVTLEQEASVKVTEDGADFLLMPPNNDWVYVIKRSGKMFFFEVVDGEAQLVEAKHVGGEKAQVKDATLLLGGISILVADSEGMIHQYFPVRNQANEYSIQHVRQFEQSGQHINQILAESRRKSFVSVSESGEVGLYHTTSHRTVLSEKVLDKPIKLAAIAAPGHRLLVLDDNQQLTLFKVENEHPDISWSALWSQVWYESYPEPDYIWQSSSSSNDFEAKFSLMPLSFGTLKAAFYAMLFAMPLAICGAIFTAYFMDARMRQYVKPVIEIMEALPTVILGFLAGLWLAPLIEDELSSIFLLLICLPIGIILFGAVWYFLADKFTWRSVEGWEGALLIPIIILVGAFTFWMGPYVEAWFFGGNMRQWISDDLGINYDQRNAMVVGLAMGFAVIPTIFSITEDAVFSVPKHLSNGSLALGANRWQTMVRVVLPTASPGIFSAVMIGLGRAVGETMIVLMATGNTPIMDANIFEGMRTLSANIATEMPESEVGSTHYRILFLAALVLFAFTFVFNTAAEIIRQRLREKYGSL